jgi:predicted MFS family arabinose efflux permease
VGRAWRTLVLPLLLIRFVDESVGFIAPGSIERFRMDLGIDYTVAGVMFAAGAAGGIAANLVVAASDGRSRKPIVVGGLYVTALGLGVFGIANGGPALLAASALVAAGATGFVHGGEIALVALVPDAGLERALAKVNLGGVAGDVAGPLILAAARAAGIGWRAVFVGAAVATAFYGLWLQRLTFPVPRRQAPPPEEHPDERAWTRRALTVVLAVGVASLLIAPHDESFLGVVLAFAERDHGFSPARAALLGVAFVSGGVLSFTILPRYIERVSTARLLAVCAAGVSAATVAAALGPGWLLIPIGVAHSALLGAAWLGIQALALRAMPGREGRALLLVEVVDSFSLLIVVGLGALADAAGLRVAILGYGAVAAALVVPAAAFRMVVRPRGRPGAAGG